MRCFTLINVKRLSQEHIHVEFFEVDHLNQQNHVVTQPGKG